MAHQIDSTVSSHWCVAGTNSRKTAESTGKFPPTPMLHAAMSPHSATASGAPPPASANTAVTRRVRLNDHLLG